MTKNDQKWPKMTKTTKMTKRILRKPRIISNDEEWPKITKNVQNDQKWPNWPEMTKRPNWSKLLEIMEKISMAKDRQ